MLYIITVVHNRYEITKKFIKQLKNQTFQNYRLILVDDGCTDGTVKMVSNELPTTIILHGSGNLWWGGGLDKAYNYIKKINLNSYDMIFICNDDITISNDFLKTGVEILSKNSQCLLSAKGYHDKTKLQVDGAAYRSMVTADGYFVQNGKHGNYATTRALFIYASIYQKIGGMHPILLPHYRSDIEYVLRAAKKGFPCVSFDALNYIVNSETTGINKTTSFLKKFSKKNINNPIYSFNFILLTTPLHQLPQYLWCFIKRKIKSKG